MIDRVNQYYQYPVSQQMTEHFRTEIGFSGKYLEILDDLRTTIGSTSFHAQEVKLPLKTYNAMSGIVGQKCVWELIRLAEIGLKAERMQK